MEPAVPAEVDSSALPPPPPAVQSLSGSLSVPVIPEFSAYKATRLTEIVCRRNVRLYRDRVQTVHCPQGTDQGNEKTWFLDRTCKLEPDYVEELISEKRTIRPPGQWTVTAKFTTVTGQAPQPIELYCVTIHWPTSWLATKGYTSFTLGFETFEEAAQWHALVQRQLSALRVRAVNCKGDSSTGHSSKPSYDEGVGLRSAGSGNGSAARKVSQGFVAAALEHFWSAPLIKDDKQQLPSGLSAWDQSKHQGSCHPIPIQQELAVAGHPASPEVGMDAQAVRQQGRESFSSSGTDGCDGAAQLLQQAGDSPRSQEEQRWVPYRHTNGVAIYHHKESPASCSLWDCSQGAACGNGSEYMASSIVKGSPDECLSVLVDLSSNTTILGPASKIELLEDGEERQVLRLVVEATGIARHLCAPREVIVERLFKREECGVDVILFSSCDEKVAAHSAFGNKWQCSPAASAPVANSLSGHSRATGTRNYSFDGKRRHATIVYPGGALAIAAIAISAAGSWRGCFMLLLLAVAALLYCARLATTSSRFHSLWYKPVRAYVQGGYTISPREDCNAVNSPECLVTCILKVDLRGFLGERCWLRPVLDAMGWVDAYVERMLMAVILVKDEVEQQRFLVQPFSILTNSQATRTSTPVVTAGSSAAGTAAGGGSGASREAGALRDGYSQHLRQQQLMRQRRRQLQLYQQQQHEAYLQRVAGQTGYPQEEAAQLAAKGFWGSGLTAGLQTGMRGAMVGPASGSLNAEYVGPYWPYRGPLLGTPGPGGDLTGLSRQQHDMLLQAAGGSPVHKRNASPSRQQGRLGRMTSRIYSLRPRLRRADSAAERTPASNGSVTLGASGVSAASAAAGLYSQISASFKNGLAALSSHETTAGAAARVDSAACEFAGATPAYDAAGACGATAGVPLQQLGGAADVDSNLQGMDLSAEDAALAALGLPLDTAVVRPQYYIGGPQGPAARCSSLHPRYWSELHVPGTPAPFKLRSASYLADRHKVDGGVPQFVLGSVDLVETAGPTQHISRFLPAVRCNDAAYSFVVNLIIPGTPVLSLVAVFINEHHPDILNGPSCSSTASSAIVGKSNPAQLQQDVQQGRPMVHRLSTNSSNGSSSSTGTSREQLTQFSGSPTINKSITAVYDAATDSSRSQYESPVGCRPFEAADNSRGSQDPSTTPAATEDAGDRLALEDDVDSGPAYERPRDVGDWQPFDFALHRFLHSGPQTRQAMFKLIPHIAEGSWVIKQSVGTVPVILGNKLQTVYYQTDRYIEATVDVTSSSAAAYITGMVRGATKSLVIDLGFVLEGQRAEELPEALLGAFRLNHLDCTQTKRIDTTQELPLLPRPLQQHQVPLMAAAAIAAAAARPCKVEVGSQSPESLTTDVAAGAAAAAEECWQAGPQRRTCSMSGALAVNASGTAPADATGKEQSHHRPQQQQRACDQPGSISNVSLGKSHAAALEAGRTMTGHAHSRSATSLEEIQLMSGVVPANQASMHKAQQPACLQPQNQRQQQPLPEQFASAASAGLASAGPAAPCSLQLSTLCSAEGTRSRTADHKATPSAAALSDSRVDAAASPTHTLASSSHSAPIAARQLFSGLLPFGNSSVVPASQHQDGPQLAGRVAAPSSTSGPGGGPTAVPALHLAAGQAKASQAAQVTSASVSAAGSLASVGNPRHAALAAPSLAGPSGTPSLMINTGTGMPNSSLHHQRSSFVGTPTASGVVASALGQSAPSSAMHYSSTAMRLVQHHRSSSGASDATSKAPQQTWPSSPLSTGQEPQASKLSAAAFISRAHAAALAASAHKRGQGGAPSAHHAAVYSCLTASSFGSPPGPSSCGGEQYAAAVCNAAAVSSSSAADADPWLGSGQGRWHRGSSTGIPETTNFAALDLYGSLAQQQQPVDATSAGCVAGCAKISATEQLRLTHSALRASATGGGAGQPAVSSLSTSHSGAPVPQGRLSAGSGAGADLAAPAEHAPGSPSHTIARRHKPNHRRFASMGAMH